MRYIASVILALASIVGIAEGAEAATHHYSARHIASLNAKCDLGNQKACDWLYARGLRTQ